MKCKYYKNGIESVLYTELFGYMDNTIPQKKSVDAVYKVTDGDGLTIINWDGYIQSIESITLSPHININLLNKFNTYNDFSNIWYGQGRGQEETGYEVYENLFNFIKTYRTEQALHGRRHNITLDDVKLFVIELDKPILNVDGSVKYPPGLSPVDLFISKMALTPSQDNTEYINRFQIIL